MKENFAKIDCCSISRITLKGESMNKLVKRSSFAIAFLSILIWGIAGPYFRYSEAWQMIVNTGTTICTFLMVFVIQNSQNRDGLALQIKLDEIIRAIGGAKNSMIDLEGLSHEELAELKLKFSRLGEKARHPALTK